MAIKSLPKVVEHIESVLPRLDTELVNAKAKLGSLGILDIAKRKDINNLIIRLEAQKDFAENLVKTIDLVKTVK